MQQTDITLGGQWHWPHVYNSTAITSLTTDMHVHTMYLFGMNEHILPRHVAHHVVASTLHEYDQ